MHSSRQSVDQGSLYRTSLASQVMHHLRIAMHLGSTVLQLVLLFLSCGSMHGLTAAELQLSIRHIHDNATAGAAEHIRGMTGVHTYLPTQHGPQPT